MTCHPSHISKKERASTQSALEELRKAYAEGASMEILPEKVSELAKRITQDISLSMKDEERISSINYIPALKYAESGSEKEIKAICESEQHSEKAAQELIEMQTLKKDYDFDEIDEHVSMAKNWLLNGNSIYTFWLDYDGAKRPAGMAYDVYAALILEDVSRMSRKDGENTKAQKVHMQLTKIGVAIHALSKIMSTEEKKYHIYNQVMNQLKKQRYNCIKQLIDIRDRKEEQLAPVELAQKMSFSRRLRINIRVSVHEAKAAQSALEKEMHEKPSHAWSKEEKESLGLIENIVRQVAELNTLSGGTRTQYVDDKKVDIPAQKIISQIMVANCGETQHALSPTAAAKQIMGLHSLSRAL